jgi:hypothetical protein
VSCRWRVLFPVIERPRPAEFLGTGITKEWRIIVRGGSDVGRRPTTAIARTGFLAVGPVIDARLLAHDFGSSSCWTRANQPAVAIQQPSLDPLSPDLVPVDAALQPVDGHLHRLLAGGERLIAHDLGRVVQDHDQAPVTWGQLDDAQPRTLSDGPITMTGTQAGCKLGSEFGECGPGS